MSIPTRFTQLSPNVKSFFASGRALADTLRERSPTLTSGGHGYIARNVVQFNDDTGCLLWGGYHPDLKATPYMRNLHQMDARYPTHQTGIRAARFVWQVINQHYHRDQLHVRHLCANSRCMQPAHLALGTHYENQRDRVLTNRGLLLMPTWQAQDHSPELLQQPERRRCDVKTPWGRLRLVHSAPRVSVPSVTSRPPARD